MSSAPTFSEDRHEILQLKQKIANFYQTVAHLQDTINTQKIICIAHLEQQQQILALHNQSAAANTCDELPVQYELTTNRPPQSASAPSTCTVTCTQKRKTRDELGETAIRNRNKEEEKAFKTTASLFGQQAQHNIQRIEVKIEYSCGNERVFTAYERPPEENGDDLSGFEETEQSAVEYTEKIVDLKTRLSLSYHTLHELRMLGMPVPQMRHIKEQCDRLSSSILVLKESQDCSRRRLQDLLEHLLLEDRHAHLMATDASDICLQLRFAADGAKMAKTRDSVRGVFKLVPPRPDEKTTPSMRPEDEITLFLFMGSEDRQSTERHAASTFKEMQQAAEQGLEVHGKTVKVMWWLSSDWKAMAMLKGVNAPNADYFCLWCKCTKKQIRDFSVPSWDVSRSRDEQTRIVSSTDKACNKLGYNRPDLLPFIPYSRVIPDELHLRIRIINKLLNQVVRWCIELKRVNQLKEEMRRHHVDFRLTDEAGDGSKGKVLKWSQPSGDHLMKILHNMDLVRVLGEEGISTQRRSRRLALLSVSELRHELEVRHIAVQDVRLKADLVKRLDEAMQPGEQVTGKRLGVSYEFHDEDQFLISDGQPEEDSLNTRRLQDLWKAFADLTESIKARPGTDKYKSPQTFQKAAREWAVEFCEVTYHADVIPYLHCLVYHVPQALQQMKFLPDIGCSQVERKNFDQRNVYFNATNRDGGNSGKSVSHQILEIENIQMYFSGRREAREKLPNGRCKRRKPLQAPSCQ